MMIRGNLPNSPYKAVEFVDFFNSQDTSQKLCVNKFNVCGLVHAPNFRAKIKDRGN